VARRPGLRAEGRACGSAYGALCGLRLGHAQDSALDRLDYGIANEPAGVQDLDADQFAVGIQLDGDVRREFYTARLRSSETAMCSTSSFSKYRICVSLIGKPPRLESQVDLLAGCGVNSHGSHPLRCNFIGDHHQDVLNVSHGNQTFG